MTAWTQSNRSRFTAWLNKKVQESPDRAVLLATEFNMPSMQVMHWAKLEPFLTMSFKTYLAETADAGQGDKRKLDYILVGETAQGCWNAFQKHYADTRTNAMADHDQDDEDGEQDEAERKAEILEFVNFLDHIAGLIKTRLETHFSCTLAKTLH